MLQNAGFSQSDTDRNAGGTAHGSEGVNLRGAPSAMTGKVHLRCSSDAHRIKTNAVLEPTNMPNFAFPRVTISRGVLRCLPRNFALGLCAAVTLGAAAHAATCPFDSGSSTLAVDGLILTRYALGITGSQLVANTGIADGSAQTVVDAINSPAWGLNLTGGVGMSPADATIISRRLAGFSGQALTNGLALGSGSRNTPSAVESFLLSGCPGTAWIQGGNTFGAPGIIGSNDAQPITLKSGGDAVSAITAGGHGLRISQVADGILDLHTNSINGSQLNSISLGVVGATISGGGFLQSSGVLSRANRVTGNYGTVGGGYLNVAAERSSIGGGVANQASGSTSVIAGGSENLASGTGATISGGGSNIASSDDSVVSGGNTNVASGYAANVAGGVSNAASNTASVVGGGQSNTASGSNSGVSSGSGNIASGSGSVVSGGLLNEAKGFASAALGGNRNIAGGDYSVAMGRRANIGINAVGAFSFADASNFDFTTNTANMFRVRATGGVQFVTDIDGSGNPTWTCAASAGNGWSCSSDRSLKQALVPLDGREILTKLAALPLYQWQPKGTHAHIKHVGPMAQDFMKAFGLGDSDKMIGMQDADGVALAAIQGLHRMVKDKDAKIASLERANAQMQRELAAIKKRLGM